MNTDLLKQLCEVPGVPGREERVRALIESQIEGLFDETSVDAMGNMICRRFPRAARKAGSKKTASRARRVSKADATTVTAMLEKGEKNCGMGSGRDET